MKRTGSFLVMLFLTILCQSPSYAQNIPSVAAFRLSSNDVGEHIAVTVNDLVFSFIRELRTYKVLDMRLDELPRSLAVPDGADYIFYGTMTGQADGIRLELVLKGGPQGITRIISRVYENSNRILLESRSLVRDLFDQSITLPDPLPSPEAPQVAIALPEAPPIPPETLGPITSLDALAGSWIGEKGVDKVMILRGGRGVAVLASGISISLELYIQDEALVVRQKGSINPRQFMDLPDTVARQAAAVAPPLEWRFRITADQKTLQGTKSTVLVKNDGTNMLSMDRTSLEVSWKRD